MSQGRTKQKARTRQAIVRAAGTLLARGERPGLDEIAEAAQVSRATAYRYFPGLDALLSEAAVDLMVPDADEMFGADMPADPLARMSRVDQTFDLACRKQEVPLRLMLARVLERSIGRGADEPPLRQNRRTPIIERALAPLAPRLSGAALARLTNALAMVVGTEAFLALNDVLGLDEEEAREVRRWTIAALITAAEREAQP